MKSLKALLMLAGLSTALVAFDDLPSAESLNAIVDGVTPVVENVVAEVAPVVAAAVNTVAEATSTVVENVAAEVAPVVAAAVNTVAEATSTVVENVVAEAAPVVAAAVNTVAEATSTVVETATEVVTSVVAPGASAEQVENIAPVATSFMTDLYAKFASFGSSVSESAKEAGKYASTKANEFGSSVYANATEAGKYVSTKASEAGTISAKFYADHETAVNVTAVVVTVATIAALIKYNRDGYLFYKSEVSEKTNDKK